MKRFAWNIEKNEQLKTTREIAFEDVIVAIQSQQLLAILEHHNKDRYPNQQIFVVNINDYAWIIPFVETDDEIFLKTAIPSRKLTKLYLGK